MRRENYGGPLNIKTTAFATIWGGLIGGLAVFLADPSEPPRPRLHTLTWVLRGDEGQTISPDRSLELPMRYGDFDLNFRVVMPPKGELDLIFRKVEHWGPDGAELPIFHTRFAVLRMSTHRSGPGFLTREQALFGDLGGIRVGAGEPGASLQLECRGRHVKAVVNGEELPDFITADEFGNLALCARGGAARVLDFSVTPWPTASRWPGYVIGAICGAAAGLLLGLLGSSLPLIAGAMLLVLAGPFVGRALILDSLLPAIDPLREAVLAVGLSLLPMAVALALPKPRLAVRIPLALILGGAVGFASLEWAARAEVDNLQPFEDERLDLYFGRESGTAPFDAMTRMLRCRFVSHKLLPSSRRYDVLLLGGRAMFDHREAEHNVDAQLPAHLKIRLGLTHKQHVECAAIPTELSHVYQQFLLLRHYYHEYRPKVVVMGITGEEMARDLRLPARRLAEVANGGRAVSSSTLIDLLATSREGAEPLQSPQDLIATLGELRDFCRTHDSGLVLAVEATLPPAYWELIQGFAKQHSITVVQGFDVGDKQQFPVEDLAAAVADLLRKD